MIPAPPSQIAVSNIAWTPQEDKSIAALLQRRGVTAIEVAPARLFPDPAAIAKGAARDTVAFWRDHGIRLAAMQGLLFGHPHLALFASNAAREAMADQLRRMIALAAELGCGPLVFGSPSNRRRGELPSEQADHRAAAFFRPLAEFAQEHGCWLCFEPNAASYGCDYVRTIGEAAALARLVDHPTFRVQLDVGNFMMERDSIDDVRTAAPLIGHCHASAPNLLPLGQEPTPLATLIATARAGGYRGLVSVEMRKPEAGSALAAIERALDYVIEAVSSVDA
jgi:D-psicose/D-tagatose/L-ribulose 3-epimerase